MTEVQIGNEWIDLPDDIIHWWIETEKAEWKEVLLWRPLDCVVGYQDFIGMKERRGGIG